MWALFLHQNVGIPDANLIKRSAICPSKRISASIAACDIIRECQIPSDLLDSLVPTGKSTTALLHSVPNTFDENKISKMLDQYALMKLPLFPSIERVATRGNSGWWRITFDNQMELWKAYSELNARLMHISDSSNFYVKMEICK